MTNRQDIVDLLITTLQKIKTDNGFSSDIGKNIFDYSEIFLNKDNTPAIRIYDYKNTIDPDKPNSFHNILSIRLDIISVDDHVINLRNHIRDIYKVLGENEDLFWSTYQAELNPESDEMIHEKDMESIASAQLYFTITYPTPKWMLE